ncbi:hypothetical protein ACE1TH_17230 [Shouchella sp. JSM 1781072]|nr:hypothetical protein [Alkalihalobacillus sp. LMS6]
MKKYLIAITMIGMIALFPLSDQSVAADSEIQSYVHPIGGH